MASPAEEHPAVTRFREYLRIPTVSGNDKSKENYDVAMIFLTQQAEEIGLKCRIIYIDEAHPVMLMTWEGTRPDLKSILLNSHSDVVPVFPEHWSSDPFVAHKKENGDIVARGTQDMKCCGMWYLEAIRVLKAAGKKFPRTIHISFVPDEEVGSVLGMEAFVQTEDFKNLNVGFNLDEGLANPTENCTVFYGERSAWWFSILINGNPGHGSRFIENTVGEKLRIIINHALSFRDEQKERYKKEKLTLGSITSLNLTICQGGVQHNVVPSDIAVGFDIRITPADSQAEVMARIQKWMADAGEGVTLEFNSKNPPCPLTSTDPSDPWWRAFSGVLKRREVKYEMEIFPCGTDARYISRLGIPAIRFSPIHDHPILLHDHNEYLNEKVYVEGIPIYEELLEAVASVIDTA